jgi:hypothetical protein
MAVMSVGAAAVVADGAVLQPVARVSSERAHAIDPLNRIFLILNFMLVFFQWLFCVL